MTYALSLSKMALCAYILFSSLFILILTWLIRSLCSVIACLRVGASLSISFSCSGCVFVLLCLSSKFVILVFPTSFASFFHHLSQVTLRRGQTAQRQRSLSDMTGKRKRRIQKEEVKSSIRKKVKK